MTSKFLDYTGLSYFCSKIKAWCNATFAVITHNQASNTITAMTGYSKPGSTSAISTSDTLNQAVGKLERAVVDADISNVVHRTGDETVQGVKTFKNAHAWVTNGRDALSSIQIQSTELERNAAPINYSRFAGVIILDKNAISDLDFVNRLGALEFQKDVDSESKIVLKTYNPDTTDNEVSDFSVGWLNSIPFAIAPSTSLSRTNGRDIVTRDWISKDARIVHTTGDETVNGQKVFTENIHRKTTSFSRGTAPSATVHVIPFNLIDSSNNDVAGLYYRYYADKSCKWSLFLRKSIDASNDWSELGIGYSDDGTIYTFTPTPALDSNSSDIVNTAWIRAATGNTSLNAATATKLANARTIRTNLASTSTASFDGSANVTPGVTGTLGVANGGTGLTSLDTFVRTTGDQTVNGAKTFSTGITVANNSPSYVVKDTNGDWTGTSPYTAFTARDKNNEIYARIDFSAHDSRGGGVIAIRCRKANSTDFAEINLNLTSGNCWLFPTDNYLYLGGAGNRWKQLYASSTTISTSDEREKRDIVPIPDEVLDAWSSVEFAQFRFNDAFAEKGESARTHSGLIAQRIWRAFDSLGLDASKYGLFCYDEWDAEEPQYNEKGELERKGREAGNRYALRYEEALCMEAACMRRENKILKNRISELENQLASVLKILQSLKGAN